MISAESDQTPLTDINISALQSESEAVLLLGEIKVAQNFFGMFSIIKPNSRSTWFITESQNEWWDFCFA